MTMRFPQNSLLDYVLINTPEVEAPPNGSVEGGSPPAATVLAPLQTSPFCGDGTCDAGESCSTCAQDCKQVRKRRGILALDFR